MMQEKNNIEKNNLSNIILDNEKKMAALSYVWILCLVPLFGFSKSKFVKFHSMQGLIILGLSLFTIVPVFGWFLGLILFTISIIGIIKTLNGKWWKIPYIYDWSKKIKLNI